MRLEGIADGECAEQFLIPDQKQQGGPGSGVLGDEPIRHPEVHAQSLEPSGRTQAKDSPGFRRVRGLDA